MKISKLFAITLQSKTRLIFFGIAFTYNLMLGLYLKDFLVLSPTLTAFYLLSALPTLFLLVDTRSKVMRTVIYILMSLIVLMNFVYSLECRRMLIFPALVTFVIVVLYFGAFAEEAHKDSFLTKIYTLAVTGLIVMTLFSAYNFVTKPEAPYLTNGGATLWDTQTEELANDICSGCETDEEKVQAFYHWIIQNFEYDFEADPLIQSFNVRKTLKTQKGVCFDFSHLFAAFCRSQNIPCYAVDGASYKNGELHTWNRVYYNGSWWNLDLTSDIAQMNRQGKLYGFHSIEREDSPDNDYMITKIY